MGYPMVLSLAVAVLWQKEEEEHEGHLCLDVLMVDPLRYPWQRWSQPAMDPRILLSQIDVDPKDGGGAGKMRIQVNGGGGLTQYLSSLMAYPGHGMRVGPHIAIWVGLIG